MPIATINPATGETLQVFAAAAEEEIEKRLHAAEGEFQTWRKASFKQRAEKMQRLAKLLEERKEEYGRLMALEMGKPIQGGVSEAVKCATGARFYAENTEGFLAREPVKIDGAQVSVWYQPLGVILAVMPWNFPFWQVIRFAAPALMAGNAALLKHASNVPQCALALEKLFKDAGFPPELFQTLLIGSAQVERVIEDRRVAAVTLTGSEGAGSKVAATAGRVIKKTVLELGGSDPFIVMPSANLERAVSTAVKARTVNSGQSCIAAKRFIVHEQVYREFSERFVAQMEALKVGDPLDPKTDVGPMATGEIRDGLHDQVSRSVTAGARLLLGGKPMEGKGFYYPPTVLAEIPKSAPAYREELFGPVALLFKVSSAEEAIDLANDSDFGLGSSVWTNDAREMERFAAEIAAGQVFINEMVASDPRVPFGGVKRSGYGRELGCAGIREFVNAKTVWIKS